MGRRKKEDIEMAAEQESCTIMRTVSEQQLKMSNLYVLTNLEDGAKVLSPLSEFIKENGYRLVELAEEIIK